MSTDQQIPRNALVWSIITLFALVVPHLARIPLWILGVYVFAALWRFQVYRGRWSFPGRWVKAFLIFTSLLSLYFSFGSLFGLEPTVALLLTAFALKLLELARRKDGYVLLFLAYFVCVTEFLFSQDILVVLYSMVTVTLITTALLALHQPEEHRFNPRTIRPAAMMLAQAFPLMLVLFFLFPRIGPLWSVPLQSQAAKTGVSDFMRPGDISNLSQSSEVAFRVQFDGDIPAVTDLYWRGLVFSKLEQGAWRALDYIEIPAAERRPLEPQLVGSQIRYRIIMEPTHQGWLYSLRYAVPEQAGVMVASDYRLYSPVVLEDEYHYSVVSWPDVLLEPELSPWRRKVELALPAGRNPQTLALASALYRESGNERAFIDTVLRKFNMENYVYTLRPPTLGEDAMDEFMFTTRRGFCEHYAYAFVVMMRAAGIPARVIAGYQGGEVNPVNRTVIVYQFDAHAWAEVWLEGEGWVRVDPTAAVAPERIELGLEQAMAAEGSFLTNSPLSPLRYRSIAWVNNLRLRYDALTWQWQNWIVGYDADTQYNLLSRWFGEINGRKFALVLLGSWVAVLAPLALVLFLRRRIRQLPTLEKFYLLFCKKMAKAGLERGPGEAPGAFCVRVRESFPLQANEVTEISELYCRLAYTRADEMEADALRTFKRMVNKFRPPKL